MGLDPGDEVSRFPVEERTHMPGSSTTQDRICARVGAHPRFAFRCDNGVGVPIDSFAAQWLAYTHPCRRFAPGLAADDARLGADVVRCSFIIVDLHHQLVAGLPVHRHPIPTQVATGRSHFNDFAVYFRRENVTAWVERGRPKARCESQFAAGLGLYQAGRRGGD